MKSIKLSFGHAVRGLAATAVWLAASYVQAGDMTNGVVKRVDAANGKLTIKHEEIVLFCRFSPVHLRLTGSQHQAQ